MLKNRPQPRRGASAGVTKSLGMAGKSLRRKAPVAKPGGFKPKMPIVGAGRTGGPKFMSDVIRGGKAPTGVGSAKPKTAKIPGPGDVMRAIQRGKK